MRLIDIHCHIIPGVDDGAKSKQETIEMLKMMKQEGVVAIIATPHYRPGMFTPDIDKLQKRYLWARKTAEEMGIYMWRGNECYVQENLLDDLSVGKCIPMAKSKYLLVEFSSFHSYNVVRQYIANVISEGYIPIIAHIERIPVFDEHESRIQDMVELGARIQVNAESILGQSGYGVKRRMMKLMKADLIHYVASDSHGAKKRVPNLGKCYRYVAKKMGSEYANEIFYENQKRIIK